MDATSGFKSIEEWKSDVSSMKDSNGQIFVFVNKMDLATPQTVAEIKVSFIEFLSYFQYLSFYLFDLCRY